MLKKNIVHIYGEEGGGGGGFWANVDLVHKNVNFFYFKLP